MSAQALAQATLCGAKLVIVCIASAHSSSARRGDWQDLVQGVGREHAELPWLDSATSRTTSSTLPRASEGAAGVFPPTARARGGELTCAFEKKRAKDLVQPTKSVARQVLLMMVKGQCVENSFDGAQGWMRPGADYEYK